MLSFHSVVCWVVLLGNTKIQTYSNQRKHYTSFLDNFLRTEIQTSVKRFPNRNNLKHTTSGAWANTPSIVRKTASPNPCNTIITHPVSSLAPTPAASPVWLSGLSAGRWLGLLGRQSRLVPVCGRLLQPLRCGLRERAGELCSTQTPAARRRHEHGSLTHVVVAQARLREKSRGCTEQTNTRT